MTTTRSTTRPTRPTKYLSVERLLALADHYQQKAEAFRLVAAEVNGRPRAEAEALVGATLRAAGRLRQHQTETARAARARAQTATRAQRKTARAPGVQPKTAQARTERERLLRERLRLQGPQSTRTLVAYLEEQGHRVSRPTVGQTLRAMKDVRHSGATQTARWSLRKAATAAPTP